MCNLITHGNENTIFLNAESTFLSQINTGLNNSVVHSKIESSEIDNYYHRGTINQEEVNRQRIINNMIKFKMKDYDQYAKKREKYLKYLI